MSSSNKLKQQAEINAAKDKKRIVYSVIGLALCVGILAQLNDKANEAVTEVPLIQDHQSIDIQSMLPEFDAELLSSIKDSADSERVILEPEAFAATA